MSTVDRANHVCIIGAGSSGLPAARHFRDHGFHVDVIDRETDLGGNWNFDNCYARVYQSARMISSRKFTQYPDFPMPRTFPDYPHHSHILRYLRDYAEHFDLLRWIRFDAAVLSVAPIDRGKRWEVTVKNQKTGEVETWRYGFVVIANGHNWSPRLPSYPGKFDGEVIHSADYKRPHIMRGKRVLIVGAGNTGCDIAVEAVHHADAVYQSMRRGYFFFPKYVFGQPSDRYLDRLAEWGVPLIIRRKLAALMLRFVVGSPHRFGLPTPDHKPFETHPVINSLLPYYVRHGAIHCKPDVATWDGRDVVFKDDSHETVDLVILATGYRIEIPFIDPEHLNWRGDRPHLYQNVFHPEYDNLFLAGLIQPDSGQFGLVHWQTLGMARFAALVRDGSPLADRLRQIKAASPDLTDGHDGYVASERHTLEVEHWGYQRGLKKLVSQLPVE